MECREHCSSEKLKLPFFGDCGDYFHFCGKRKGAKYQNNQCYNLLIRALSKTQTFLCLNRNDIDEAVLAKSAIFEDEVKKRLDLFQYFTNHNKTHIICGDQVLKKEVCDFSNLFSNTPASVKCKKKDGDMEETNISHHDICKDSFFMKETGYSKNEINLSKRITTTAPIHPYIAKEGSCGQEIDTKNFFFCNKSQRCIQIEQGNTACDKS